MPIIKARPADQKETVLLKVRLTRENHRTLADYTAFLGEEDDTDYVVNQLVESVLARDKDFIASRRVDKADLRPSAAKRERVSPPVHNSPSARNGGGGVD